MLDNYIVYLNFITEKLNKFFERQKPFIFCKKGCAMCCKNAQFPYSKLEVDYLLFGYEKLDIKIKEQIMKNIENIKKEKSKFKGNDIFKYDCPFLINNECIIYEYRGIVCRTFGLISKGENGKIKIPSCALHGYNYANVLDKNENKISAKKLEELKIKEEPVAFNINYKFLTNPDFERGFNISFKEKKALIEWFI